MGKAAGQVLAASDLPAVGTVTITGTTLATGVSAFTDVTFATAFPSTPVVVVNLTVASGTHGYLVPRAISVTTSGFRCSVYNVGSASATFGNLTLGWNASL